MQANPRQHHPHLLLATALRWTARAWGLASTLLLLAFAFGGREHLRFTAGEAMVFLLFPVGLIVGLVLAWWRELAGGLVAVGSFLVFCLLLAKAGRTPNLYFLLFAAPAFLHLVSARLRHHGLEKNYKSCPARA